MDSETQYPQKEDLEDEGGQIWYSSLTYKTGYSL